MTIRELGTCTLIRRPDKLVEFRKNDVGYFGICWQCRDNLFWDNWTSHKEPIRTWCPVCQIHIPIVHLNLEPAWSPASDTPSPCDSRLLDLPK